MLVGLPLHMSLFGRPYYLVWIPLFPVAHNNWLAINCSYLRQSSLISHTTSELVHFLPNYVTNRPDKMIQLPDFIKLQVPSGESIISQLLSCDTIIINYYVPSTVSVACIQHAFQYAYHAYRDKNGVIYLLSVYKITKNEFM